MKKTELARGAVPLKRTSPLARKATAAPRQQPSAPRQRPKTGDWPPEVRDTVQRRSRGICEVTIVGKCTGAATDLHHRQARRTRVHTVPNCLHLCRRCHQAVHTVSPALAQNMGWIVSSHVADPGSMPVFVDERWHLLTEHGTYQPTEAPL